MYPKVGASAGAAPDARHSAAGTVPGTVAGMGRIEALKTDHVPSSELRTVLCCVLRLRATDGAIASISEREIIGNKPFRMCTIDARPHRQWRESAGTAMDRK